MFRFLHAADIHLDSAPAGLRLGARDRPEAFAMASRRALERLVDAALAQQVRFVLLAGDNWDGSWKDASTGLFFAGQMAKLKSAGIPVVAIRGNHDAEASASLGRVELPGVRFLSTTAPESVPIAGLDVVVHGQGYGRREVTERLVQAYPDPVPGRFNIGLLHTALDGSSEGHAPYAPCSVAELVACGYDYWALGHVHTRQTVRDADPVIHYPGNIQGRSIRETGPRGATLVTVAGDGDPRLDFLALDVVRWAVVPVDLAGCDGLPAALARIERTLGAALDGADGRSLAVRVVLTGATPLDNELRAMPQTTEANVLGLLPALGDDLWVEKVQVATRPMGTDRTRADDGPTDSLEAVVALAASLNGQGPERDLVATELAALAATLPPWVAEALDGTELDPAAVQADALAMITLGLAGDAL